jgi:hypothetical protein
VPLTLPQLALELRVPVRRVRDYLRPDAASLELTDAQAEDIRQAFRVSRDGSDENEWPLEPGDSVARRELHAAFGGSRQNGIVTLKSRADILVFTSPTSSTRYGYDLFEGLQEDGSFAYTGEGQRGHQEFTRGNRAIRDSGPDGRPIRLFTVAGSRATYVGEFATGAPTCWVETIPDVSGEPRRGIIFNLIPVDALSSLLATADTRQLAPIVSSWVPPDASDVVVVDIEERSPGDRVVTRIEFALQAEFGEWLRKRGTEPTRLVLPVDGVQIEPDLYVESLGWIVEAKRSSSREHVRTALGQVLDYVHIAETVGLSCSPVVLLPGRPSPNLLALLAKHKITLAMRSGDGFEIIPS